MPANNRPDLVEKLTEGIAKLTTTDEWQRFLDCQSRFNHYSASNVMLIMLQTGGYATRVAGFRAWQKMNRFVRKGEKAIYVLAPMVYKRADENSVDDNDRVIKGFKYVPVFDVSQTDGEELPSVCNRLVGDDAAGLFAQLVAVANSIGFTVEDCDFAGGPNGDCSHLLHRIRVEISNSPAQRIKTLAHELAHALLHEKYDDRKLAELEAESTAYVVCQSLGLESSDYSFGYVATWAGGGDNAIAGIKASCDRIQKTAAAILRSFDADDEAVAKEAIPTSKFRSATALSRTGIARARDCLRPLRSTHPLNRDCLQVCAWGTFCLVRGDNAIMVSGGPTFPLPCRQCSHAFGPSACQGIALLVYDAL